MIVLDANIPFEPSWESASGSFLKPTRGKECGSTRLKSRMPMQRNICPLS
jgi:hypothetical protein